MEINIFNDETRKFLLKIFMSNFIMFVSILVIKLYFENIFIVTFGGILLGSVIYFLSSKLLKIEETSLFITLFGKLIKTDN